MSWQKEKILADMTKCFLSKLWNLQPPSLTTKALQALPEAEEIKCTHMYSLCAECTAAALL